MAGSWRDTLSNADARTAAPAGLQQQQGPGQSSAQGAPDSPAWQQTLDKQNQSTRRPAWESGGQRGSTENGWNTPFYEKMFQQQKQYSDSNTMNAWYKDRAFTGVATWNGQSDHSGRRIQFGDIYEDGQFRGNLLDEKSGYSKDDAYSMLAQLTLDADEQARAYKGLRDDPTSVQKAVTSRMEDTTKSVLAWESQQKYGQNVQQQKSEWDDTAEGWAVFGAGAAGGAALGTVAGPWGAIAGAAIGGLSALANRDQLVETAAAAAVQTDMAADRFGAAGAISTGLRQWGGAAMGAISPLSNTVQGLTDLSAGTIGDDRSEYYEMEDRPWWLTGIGLGATLGDSLLQFASPVGRGIFFTSMGASTAGGVGQLAFQDGATFDDRTGTFDRPDDLGQWMAAIGAVGIDAIQLGGARGISKAVQNSGEALLGSTDDVARGALFNRAMPDGAVRSEAVGGRTFFLDDAGQVVGSPKTNFTVLAPSEATMWASARVQALTVRAQQAGAVSPQQANQILYQAAKDLEGGTNLAKTALVNGFGEGAEELVQSVLEPISHGWAPDPNDLIMSYLQGAAAGAGMSVGAAVGSRFDTSRDSKAFARVNQLRGLNNMPKMDRAEWDKLDPATKRQVLQAPPVVSQALREVAERSARSQMMEAVQFDAGAARLMDAMVKERDRALRAANPALEGTYTIGALQSTDVPNHVVQSDLRTVVELLQVNADAISDRLQATPDDVLTQQLAEASGQLTSVLRDLEAQFLRPGADEAAIVDKINEVIKAAYNNVGVNAEGSAQAGPLARVATIVLSRSPNNSAGSFQGLMPQVSLQDTRDGGRGLLSISQALLEMIDGDFDGDMMREHVNLLFNDDAFRKLRLGMNALGKRDRGVKIGNRATEDFAVTQLGIELATGGPAAEGATAMLNQLDAWLMANFPNVPNIRGIVADTIRELSAGDMDAKQNLFRRLNTTASDEMAEVAEKGSASIPAFSSPYLAIDQKFFELLQRFTEARAARRPEPTLNYDQPTPIAMGSTEADRAALSAATWGATMHQATPGNDPFRAAQHLHYGDYRSPVESGGRRPETELDRMAAMYEQLSSGISRSVLESVFAKDEVTRRAFAMLRSLARANGLTGNGVVTEAKMAALAVPNFVRQGTEFIDNGGYISLGQYVLREAARQAAIENPLDFEDKLSLYNNMDAGEAFIEIFDAMPLGAIIGDAANNFGPQLSVGQLKAQLLSKDSFSRRNWAERARADVRYTAKRHDLPYSYEEIFEAPRDERVSDYQVFVDSLLHAADQELSSDPKTGQINPGSRLYQRDQQMQASIEASLDYARTGLEKMAKLHHIKLTSRKGEVNAQGVYKLLDMNPAFTRALTELLPTEVVPVIFAARQDGSLAVRRWFAEMLVQPPKQAVMTFFRNTLQAQLNALGAQKNPKQVDDRMVQLFLQLQTDPPRLARLTELLLKSEDLTVFMETVNKEFQTGAPQLAWFRDAAQFDPSRSSGGWSKALPGAELRENMRNFNRAAVSFNDYAHQELHLDSQDKDLAAQLGHALRQVQNGQRADDEALLIQLQSRFKAAAQLRPSLGPTTLTRTVYGAISGFMGDMTDKGKGATFYEVLANIQALGYSPLQGIGYLQLLGATTAWDADDAASNMGLFAGQNLRLADRVGRVSEWEALSNTEGQGVDKYQDVARFLEMWKDPAYRPMLRAMVFPTTFESLENGGMSQQLLTKMGLRDLLGQGHDGAVYSRMLGSTRRADLLRYFSQVDAQTTSHGQSFGLTRMAADLGIARTSSAYRTLDPLTLQSMADDALVDVARLVRTMGAYGDQAEARKLVEDAVKRMGRAFVVDSADPETTSLIEKALEVELLSDEPGYEDRDAIVDRLIHGDGETLQQYMQTYLIDWANPAQSVARQGELLQMILDQPSIAETSNNDAIRMLRTATMTDATGVIPVLSANPKENQALWDQVAQGVLVSKFTAAVTGVTSTRVSASALPKSVTYETVLDRVTGELKRDQLGYARYMDPSYRYLLDAVLTEGSSVLLADRDLRKAAGDVASSYPTVDRGDLKFAIDAVLNPEKLGRWTPEIARQSIDAQQRIDSSGASRQVASSGILYAKYAAVNAATQFTYAHPSAAGVQPREYTLTPLASKQMLSGDFDSLSDALNGATVEPLAFLNGRALTAASVIYRAADGTAHEVDLVKDAPVSPTHQFQGSAAVRRVGLGFTSVEELRASIGSVVGQDAREIQVSLSFYHPADQPAGETFANNIFFEGAPQDNVSNSHAAALIMGQEGLNVTEQQAALKANKKGTLSLINPKLPTLEEVKLMEADPTDLYALLQAKTMYLLSNSTGHEVLDPTYYNAVFKDLKLRHGIRVSVEGGPTTLLSAEEAIALQAAGQMPEGNIELVVLSDRMLKTLLGEQDVHGLQQFWLDAPTVDSAGVKRWKGSLSDLAGTVEGLRTGEPARLLETRVGARSEMSQSSIRDALSVEELNLLKRRLEVWGAQRAESDSSRRRDLDAYKKRIPAAIRTLLTDQGILSTLPQYALYEAGVQLNLPLDANPASGDIASQTAFATLNATLNEMGSTATAWTYSHNQQKIPGGRADGVLHGIGSLGDRDGLNEKHGDKILHRDLVVVRLDTFPVNPLERKRDLIAVMRKLAERGASIAIVDQDGDLDTRVVNAGDLDKLMYRQVPGARGLYVPFDPSSSFRTLEAMYSRLAEVREIHRDALMSVFHSRQLSVSENAALVNFLREKNGREVVLTSSLAPTTAYQSFGIAATELQRQDAKARLQAISQNEDALRHLLSLSKQVEGDRPKTTRERRADETALEDLRAAFAKAATNYDESTGLPAIDSEFGPGDILVFVGPGGRMIFSRHGYEPIADLQALSVQLATPVTEGGAAGNVAIYGTTPLGTATTYSGRIRAWTPMNGYGWELRQSIPLIELGNKGVGQVNGIKLISSGDITKSPHELPEHGFLRSMDVDILMHWDDARSKESFDGLVNTAQNAIGYFGADFAPAYAQTLLGVDRAAWDSSTAEEQGRLRTALHDLFSDLAGRSELDVASTKHLRDQLFRPGDTFDAAMSSLRGLSAFADRDVDTAFMAKPLDQRTPEEQVTMAALVYLMYKEAAPGHVMGAPGLDAPKVEGRPQSFIPPELFTGVFDDAPIGSSLRGYFFDELNSRINNVAPASGDRATGYRLSEDWTFTILNENPEKNLEGYIQFNEFHSSGHNSVIKEQSRERNEGGVEASSRQQTLVAEQALGAQMFRAKDLPGLKGFIQRKGVVDEKTAADVLGVFQNPTLAKVPGYSLSTQLLPAERVALQVQRDARIQFQQELDTSEWNTTERSEWDTLRQGVVLDMGLTESHAHRVDTWVRAWLGRPAAASDQDSAVGRISFADAKDAITLGIRVMLAEGRYPVDAASMNQMGLDDVLALAQVANKPGVTWKLRDADGKAAESLEDFVAAAVTSYNRLAPEPLFMNAVDGFFNTFRDLGDVYSDMPVTRDPLKEAELYDQRTSELLLSLDPARATAMRMTDIGAAGSTLADLFGGRIHGGVWQGDYPPSSGIAAAQKRFAAWRKKNNIPDYVPMTHAQMREGGMRFVTHGTSSNAVLRILTNMRAANGMLNPWLFATAPVESWIKNSVENAKAFLVGEGSGAMSQFLAGKTAEGSSMYGSQLMAQKEAVTRALGDNQQFKGMINQDILVHPKFANAGKVEMFTAKLASIAGRWQDPSYGMKQETLARRYLDAVMRNSLVMGSRLTLSPQDLLQRLQRDPEFVKNNYPELHQYGINTVANLRSLKPTTASLLVMKNFIDPLSNNPRVMVNYPSTLMLKLPFMFFNYAANTATNMLGLQGLNAVSAMVAASPGITRFLGKSRAFLAGEGKDYTPAKHDIDFLGETLESVNLADAFIQSGLTHTGLMGLGLVAGSLGLGGEDEEDKRRRRAAQAGAGYVYDPREIENDWRNADALYLDNLPDWFPFADAIRQMYKVGEDQDGNTVSMVQLHWTLKQFISPMIGIENFLNTGNFAHVIWGFEDALGSMPLINEGAWDEAARISTELQQAALESESRGNPVDLANAYGFWINSVMTLERMLFENSFVNSIYTAADEYDRDPYTLADLNDTGEIQRDDTGQAQEATALQDYKNENGEAAQGYLQASPTEARIKGLTENRASLALMTSLFTGLADSEFIRYNMTVKTREIDQESLGEDEAMSIILSMWDPKNKREVLTEDGGLAVIKGLQMGTVKPGDPALENLFLSFEQRQAIEQHVTASILQDYLDLGLSKEKADEQLKQTMYGSESNPGAVPLWDVIWSKGAFEDAISYNPKTTYRQLNTTYVTGPDGMPWATGIARSSLENFFGQAPLQTYNTGQLGGNLGQDERLNSTDDLANMNTGRRNLERVNSTVLNPTTEDILKATTEGIQRILDELTQPSWTDYEKGYYGKGGYGRRGGGGGGGGGGGFNYRVNSPERNDATYGRNIPYVNADNPILRRSTIRRERFSSTRGRLKQWQ